MKSNFYNLFHTLMAQINLIEAIIAPQTAEQREAQISALLTHTAQSLADMHLVELRQLKTRLQVIGIQQRLEVFQLVLKKEFRIREILAISYNKLCSMSLTELNEFIIEMRHMSEQRLRNRLQAVQDLYERHKSWEVKPKPTNKNKQSNKGKSWWSNLFSYFQGSQRRQKQLKQKLYVLGLKSESWEYQHLFSQIQSEIKQDKRTLLKKFD